MKPARADLPDQPSSKRLYTNLSMYFYMLHNWINRKSLLKKETQNFLLLFPLV